MLGSEEINKSEKTGLLESEPGIKVAKLTIWVSSFQTELTRSTKLIFEQILEKILNDKVFFKN